MYVIDPHPNGSRSPYYRSGGGVVPGWQEWWQAYTTSVFPENDPKGHPLFQARTFKERVAHARDMMRQRAITTPILIDEMDNRYWNTYGYMPNCAYLIGMDGTVAYRETWFARGANSSTVDSSKMKAAISALLGR